MPRHPWDPWCEPPTLVRPRRIDPSGRAGPTRGEAAGPHWRRTSPGWYVPSTVLDELPEQRILEEAWRMPRGAVVTGWAALRLAGSSFSDGLAPDGRTRLPVPVCVGPRGGMSRGGRVRLSFEWVPPWQCTVFQGVPATRVERACFDQMRRAPGMREAVVVADAVLAARLTSLARLRVFVRAHRSARRGRQAHEALALASEHSRSPNETRLRLVAELDAGLGPFEVNRDVRAPDGRLLGVADLLDPASNLAVEYDGADHRNRDQHHRDVAKETAFRRHGLEVQRVTAGGLRDRAALSRVLREARARASAAAVPATWVAGSRGETLEEWLSGQDELDVRRDWLASLTRPEQQAG